jgi:hypothetical protein
LSDPFSSSGSAFINMDDLKGRTLLIRPDEIGTRDSKTTGNPYDYVVCDVVILDGAPSDKIEDVPGLYEGIQLTGAGVVAHLKPKLNKRNADGSRKLALQVVSQVPSAKRGQNPAWVLDLPEDMDAAAQLARDFLAKDESILAKGVQETDAFA